MNPKIIELIIQDGDEEAGLDGIALVEMPAHEANFEYFNQEDTPEDGKCSHYVLAEEQIPLALQMFQSFGQPQGELEMEGWEITKVKTFDKHQFAIISNPNQPSADEDTPTRRFRYKYVGPTDERNREFCAEMMKARRIFRREDIDQMSSMNVNEVGPPGYSIFEWRGSFNCRHKWVQLTYEPMGRIINNSNVDTGVIDAEDVSSPDTRNTATKSLGTTGKKKGIDGWGTGEKGTAQQISRDRAPRDSGLFAASNPDVSALSPYVEQISKRKKKPVLASLPLFENKADAEALAEVMGCKGSHEHKYGDKTLFMPCESHPKDDTSYEVDNTDNADDVSGSNNPMDNYGNEMSFSVFSVEERMVVGAAMVPDKMIIRRNEITGEIYYVYFTAETIKKLQQKFMIEKLLDKTNVEHGRKFLNGVSVVESWIVDDPEHDKQQVFGMSYPKGTWMCSMKIEDEAIWQKIKEGKLNGYSVQGYFLEKAKFNTDNIKILGEIKDILKQTL